VAKRHEEGRQIGGIFNRNGHWYAKIKVRGRQIWRSAATKEEAQLLLGRLREDAARERVGLPKVQRDKLADFVPKYREWAKAHKRSWDRDELSLRPLLAAFGHLRLAEITKARVEAYMRDRRATETLVSIHRREAFARNKAAGRLPRNAKPPAPATFSPASVNREVACLRKILSYAVECGELSENPLRGIRMFAEAPGRVPTLGPEDEAALVAALAPWLRAPYRLAVLSGLRQGEIVALRWRHVDFDGGILMVEDSKSGESRRVPLHPSLVDELRTRRALAEAAILARANGDELAARRELPDCFVFAMPNGRPPESSSISHAFKRAARKIGRPDLRWHDTRHLAGSALLGTGASLPEVAAMLGHKTLVMSRRYAHVNPSRLRDLVARIPAPVEALAPAGTQRGEGEAR